MAASGPAGGGARGGGSCLFLQGEGAGHVDQGGSFKRDPRTNWKQVLEL